MSPPASGAEVSGGAFGGGVVSSGAVGRAVLPGLPADAAPGAGEAARSGDLGGADRAGVREAHDDAALGRRGDGGRDAGEELGRAAPVTVALAGEEGGPGPAAADEGGCDRAVDVSEHRRRIRPVAVEGAADLAGELDAGGDEAIAAADQGAQRTDRVGLRARRGGAVAVGAQQAGEQEGAGAVAPGAAHAVARACGPNRIGADRDDRMAGLDEGFDEQAGRALAGNGQFGRAAEAGEPPAKPGQALDRAGGDEAGCRAACFIAKDADAGLGAAPVGTDSVSHPSLLSDRVKPAPIGRPGGLLIARRSGRPPLAHRPAARQGLPAPAAWLGSRGSPSGGRHRPSRQDAGRGRQPPLGRRLPLTRMRQ